MKNKGYKGMASKVNQKGASCYIISQYRNKTVFYIIYILKNQKILGKNNTYENIIIYLRAQIYKKTNETYKYKKINKRSCNFVR